MISGAGVNKPLSRIVRLSVMDYEGMRFAYGIQRAIFTTRLLLCYAFFSKPIGSLFKVAVGNGMAYFGTVKAAGVGFLSRLLNRTRFLSEIFPMSTTPAGDGSPTTGATPSCSGHRESFCR